MPEGIETFWLRRGRGNEDVRPVEDGGLHAPLLLVDAARGEAPPVVGDEVGDGGEERLHRVVHLHALLPGRADDYGERGLRLRRVIVPAQEAARGDISART